MSEYQWEKAEEVKEEIPLFINARQQELWERGLIYDAELDVVRRRDERKLDQR